MKYLVRNRKEFAITVAAFVMAVINLIRAIKSGEINEELIVAVLVTGTTVLAWYYNMPTSEENCVATGYMRFLKLQKQGITDGEDFFDEVDEDDEEEEEEDEDEL